MLAGIVSCPPPPNNPSDWESYGGKSYIKIIETETSFETAAQLCNLAANQFSDDPPNERGQFRNITVLTYRPAERHQHLLLKLLKESLGSAATIWLRQDERTCAVLDLGEAGDMSQKVRPSACEDGVHYAVCEMTMDDAPAEASFHEISEKLETVEMMVNETIRKQDNLYRKLRLEMQKQIQLAFQTIELEMQGGERRCLSVLSVLSQCIALGVVC